MTDKRRCPSCDRVASTDAPFCAYCGSRIAERRCPSCDGVVTDDASFCVHCGTSIDDNSRPSPPSQDSPTESPTATETEDEDTTPEPVDSPEPQRITEADAPQAEEPETEDKSERGKRFLRGCGIILAVIVGGFILLIVLAVLTDESDDVGGSRSAPRAAPTVRTVSAEPSFTTPIPLCQRGAESKYIGTLRNHVALITEQSAELSQNLVRMSKDPYLISNPTWKSEVGANLGFMLYGAEEILELDPPGSLYSLSQAAERMAREIKATVGLYTRGLDSLDADKANEGTERAEKAATYMGEMTDIVTRLCRS